MPKLINREQRIFVAGHKGMAGSAIKRSLLNSGYKNLLEVDRSILNLEDQYEVNKWIKFNKPDVVIIAAAKVGGIIANNNLPADFILRNLAIQTNLIKSSFENDVKRLLFLGSSCIYPKFSKQPIKEEYLLNGELEETNQWYAIAKISGVKLMEAIQNDYGYKYISVMPTNLYGPKDNFDLESSHVIPALLRKFHDAKIKNLKNVLIWGDGSPMREFLHVDDLSDAIVFSIKNNLNDYIYNVGYGKDISIKELSFLIKRIVGFEGNIIWDSTKPNGTPKKLMDSSKINNLGWSPKIKLEVGLRETYKWYLNNL